MSISIMRPLREFVLHDGEVVKECRYKSETADEIETGSLFLTADRLLKSNEEKILKWKGYLMLKETDGFCRYRKSAFVLTEENLYTVTDDFDRVFISVSYLPLCKSYCLLNENSDYLPSFVLNFTNALEFMYDKGDQVEWSLQKELRRRNIVLD